MTKHTETGKEHLERLRAEITQMDEQSQLIGRNVLVLGECIALCLTNKQFDVIETMKHEIDKLFEQAVEIRQEMNVESEINSTGRPFMN